MRSLTGLHVETSYVVEVVSIELSTKDIECGSDHTRSMRMARGRQETQDGRLIPFLAIGMEDIEGVAALVLCILAAKIYFDSRWVSVQEIRSIACC